MALLTTTFVFALLLVCVRWNLIIGTQQGQYCYREKSTTLKCNYIPRDIPFGIDSVRLMDFKKLKEIFIVNSTQFQSENWGRLKSFEISYSGDESIVTVIFKTGCFKGLKHLRELHIHLVPIFILEGQVFEGLNSLKLLDLSGCLRMSIGGLLPGLTGHGILPQLENLKLAAMNNYRTPVVINDKFAQTIGDKNITSLDLSYVRIEEINATALVNSVKTLKNVNVSFSFITTCITDKNSTINKFDQLNVLDIYHLSYFRVIPPSKMFNKSWNTSDFKTFWVSLIEPKVVNISGLLQYPSSIWISNSTLNINSQFEMRSEEFIGTHNNLKHLDLVLQCNGFSAVTIKHIDLSENGLDFIHPSLLSCSPNLQHLDLSNNELFKMVSTHSKLFQQLLISIQRLKVIKFSSNFFKDIPRDMFIKNNKLEEIDLSYNELGQVTIALYQLGNLKVLNLRDNKIKILSESSMHNLNSISTKLPYFKSKKAAVYLDNNPISCSECKAKEFLQWLTNTKSVNVLTPKLTCVNENGLTRNINDKALQLVMEICKKRIVIVTTAVSVVVAAVLIMLVVVTIHKCRKRALNKANKRTLLQNLQEGHGEFEFVTFLSHSSEDKDFVNEYLVEQLNETLQLMTGIDRNLVCTGDDFLRPGFRILDEITNCIERSSVFIVVVSDHFCESMYCHHEVEMAFRLHKPIVLMIIGQVNEDLMKPLLKTLFKSTVRVLWTIHKDEYVMNKTWADFCRAMLDLIVENIK